MWKIALLTLTTMISLVACNTENAAPPTTEEGDSTYQPMEYRSSEGIERRGQIPIGKDSYFKRTAEEESRNSLYGETNKAHDNDFNNEQSIEIINVVNELDEVTMTQAFTTDDSVFIAVMLNPYDQRDEANPEKIREKIKSKIATMTDKQITVYTNNNRWNYQKNMNARQNAAEAPKKVIEQINRFFNQNNDNR